MLGMKYVRMSILKEEMEERVEGEADLTNLATARIELKHHWWRLHFTSGWRLFSN